MKIKSGILIITVCMVALTGCGDRTSIDDFLTDAGVDLSGVGNAEGDTLYILQTPIWGPSDMVTRSVIVKGYN